MGNLKSLVCGISLILSVSALGKSTKLVSVFRTDNGQSIELLLNTDVNNDLKSIKIASKKGVKVFHIKKIKSKNGATLLRKSGIKVARIQSDDLDKVLGGHVKFIYLKKFKMLGKNIYGVVRLRVLKNANDDWYLYHNGKKISEIAVTPYRWGIKKINIK